MNINDFTKTKQAQTEQERVSIWDRDISLGGKQMSDKDKATLYHQMRTLIGAGVDIRTALELVSDQLSKKKAREALARVLEQLVAGSSLHQAYASSEAFSNYENISLRIGEESGRLPEVLDTLADYFDQRLEQRRQLVSALSYPVLIVLSSMGAVAFMLLFIIPMFEEVFNRFGSELPALTRMILAVSKFFAEKGWLLGLLLLLVVALGYMLSKREGAVVAWERLMLRIPYVGRLYLDVQLSRCAASIALLVNASVPLNQTLDFVKQMITMRHLQMALGQAQQRILKGSTLHEALAGNVVFDRNFLSLVKVGEEVNKLGDFFEKLSTEYANAASYRTKQLNTFLEPVMIVFLGLVVGLILIAMYLPMFQLSTSLEIN